MLLPYFATSKFKFMSVRTSAEVRKIRNSRQWRDKVRPQQLLDFPYCEECHKKDALTEAVEVDHKTPLESGGDPYDPDNLQSLCKRCHVIKSAEENRQRMANMPDLSGRDPEIYIAAAKRHKSRFLKRF